MERASKENARFFGEAKRITILRKSPWVRAIQSPMKAKRVPMAAALKSNFAPKNGHKLGVETKP